MKKQILQTFDIETAGNIIGKHSLLAVGMTAYEFYYKKGFEHPILNLLETVEVHILNDPIEYDDDTRIFWEKNKEAFDTINTNLMEKKKCAEILVEFIKKYQKIAIDSSMDYKLITDNCWFDASFLSWFLCTYADNGLPLRNNYYSGYMNIHNVIDLNQRVNALKNDVILDINMYVPNKTPHDHTPVNDARGIAEKYAQYYVATSPYRKRKN